MDSSEIIKQIEQTISQENERIIYYYQVYFKCSTDIYSSLDKREYGDMVIVHCDRGYNVGFIENEVNLEDFYSKHPDRNQRPKKILSFLTDDDQTIHKMLLSKIAAENYALNQCKTHIKGRKLSIFADTIATEFQFDRKKLTIYIKKYDDVSVCRLVRKLYETFKMRIKVLEVDSANTLHDIAWKYLEVSKLNIPFDEIFTFDLNSSTIPFLNTFSQPITESNLNQNSPNSNIYSNLFKNNFKSQESSLSLSSSPPLSPSSPSLSSLSEDTKPIPILEHNSLYPNSQIYHVPEVIRQTPQIISNIHTGLPLSSSSASSSSTFNQYNHDELHHYHKNNYLNNDNGNNNNNNNYNNSNYNYNQRHSAPAGLTHYQLQQLPRDPAPRSKSFSSSNIEQSSSASFKRSIHHRPIVWSSSMNENKVENRSLPQYNISAQPFYPDSHRYNQTQYSHNNNSHENNSYSHYHQNQRQHHNIKNVNMNNNHFNNESNHLLKHQSYQFQPSHHHHHHYQQSHEFNNPNFMMNEQFDHSSSPLYSKDFYQSSSSSDSHDTDDLLSQVTGRVKLLTTNSSNYPHYVFEPSQSSLSSSSSSSFFPSS